jgi:hypothetical protein
MKCVTLVRFTPKEKKSPEAYKASLEVVLDVFRTAEGFFNDDWRHLMEGMAMDIRVEFFDVRAELDNDAEEFRFYG